MKFKKKSTKKDKKKPESISLTRDLDHNNLIEKKTIYV